MFVPPKNINRAGLCIWLGIVTSCVYNTYGVDTDLGSDGTASSSGDGEPTTLGSPTATGQTTAVLGGTDGSSTGSSTTGGLVTTSSSSDPGSSTTGPQCALEAVPDPYVFDRGAEPFVVSPDVGVLANDRGAGVVVAGPGILPTERGQSVDLDVDGGFTYLPDTTFFGCDAFHYSIEDRSACVDDADVEIAVRPGTVTIPDLETGIGGSAIDGANSGANAGFALDGAADFNGDGFDDIVVGASNYDNKRGQVYVLFGGPDPPAPDLETHVSQGRGVRITGEKFADRFGYSVAGVPDFNGDGFDDIVVGADSWTDDPNTPGIGRAYVIFGSADPPIHLEVGMLMDGVEAVTLSGEGEFHTAGKSVASVDVTGDGLADVIVGASLADGERGAVYVVFGSDAPQSVSLPALGDAGFVIRGPMNGTTQAGRGVAGLRDVDGDGLGDIAVGAPQASANGRNRNGIAYIVFGADSTDEVQLDDLGDRGRALVGASSYDWTGVVVADAGDVDGDDRSDLLVSATQQGAWQLLCDDPTSCPGSAYLLLAKALVPGPPLDLKLPLAPDMGRQFVGYAHLGLTGERLAAADIDGDGRDDLAIGAYKSFANAIPNDVSPVDDDEVYIVLRPLTGAGPLSLEVLTPDIGFRVQGGDEDALASVGRAGDFNGDGLSDLVLAAVNADTEPEDPNHANHGRVYLLYGGCLSGTLGP